jgi:hypothetical protein
MQGFVKDYFTQTNDVNRSAVFVLNVNQRVTGETPWI